MRQEVMRDILRNLSELLGCHEDEIREKNLLSGGRTNTSISFIINERKLVYRHPGAQTDRFINRKAERFACEKARELGLDPSYIRMDADMGWKLSEFLEETRPFDFTNARDIAQGVQLLRRLHEARIAAPFPFDHLSQIQLLQGCLDARSRSRMRELESFSPTARRLDAYVKADGWPRCLIHGDPKAANFMVCGDRYYLIDWEYAGVKDIGYDISHFSAEIGRARSGGLWMLEREDTAPYFGGRVSEAQYRHILACFAIEEFFWSVWGLSRSAEDVVDRCWRNARAFGAKALALYETTPK